MSLALESVQKNYFENKRYEKIGLKNKIETSVVINKIGIRLLLMFSYFTQVCKELLCLENILMEEG